MAKYFYHGIEGVSGSFSETLNIILNILNEGLKTRNDKLDKNDSEYDKYNHVCLYKKNDDYDYSAPDAFLCSARGGWIITNSDEENFTDLLDSSLNEMKRGK